jgi:hypothetical protein
MNPEVPSDLAKSAIVLPWMKTLRHWARGWFCRCGHWGCLLNPLICV